MISNLLMAAGKQAPISTVDMVDPFGDGSGVALYKFDGDATDESGTYDGTAYSMTYTEGKFGQAMEGGSEKYITAPIVRTDYSVSALFYLPDLTTAYIRGLFNRGSDTMHYATGIDVYPNQVYVNVWDYNNNSEYAVVQKPIIGWNHIYMFMDANGDGFIVLNSTKENFNIGTPQFGSLASFINIGRRQLGSFTAYATTGTKIDHVRFFNRALTFEEVTALYNESVDNSAPYVPPQGFFNDGTEVAHYTFDGDVLDSVNNYDGTATNVTYATGKIGQCAVFNGSNSCVQVPQGIYASNAFSVSCWVKFNALGLEQRFVVCNSNVYSKYFRICIRTDNKISAYYGVSNSAIIISPSTCTTGVYHIVMSAIQGSNLSLYINGVLIQSIANSGTGYVNSLANELGAWIGSARGGASELLNGSLDQVRIFNRALTQTEVTALYNEGQ